MQHNMILMSIYLLPSSFPPPSPNPHTHKHAQTITVEGQHHWAPEGNEAEQGGGAAAPEAV
jgi:hypothetical protein